LRITLEAAKKRGVTVKIAAPLTEKNVEAAKKLKGFAEVKTLKDVDSRFAIIDGKQAVLMVLNDQELHPNYDVGIWLSSQPFATALTNMFENMWNEPKK
jgi:hypothetical protein